jgi:transcription-repair coupling factor (superfamily II helicase)
MEAVFEATELGAGFKIAMTDLEIRGAGNLLGSQQSGHVAAVGFDMYTNLLKDAIDRMRGQQKEERPQITVDLPFDVLIPAAYVPDERERLALYRRVATLESEVDIKPFEDELRDRFGVPPRSVRNLLTQVRVKFLAERAHITSVILRGEALLVKGERRILFDRVNLYKQFGMKAHVSENILRIPRTLLDEDWLQSLTKVLEDTIALRERQDAAVAAAQA